MHAIVKKIRFKSYPVEIGVVSYSLKNETDVRTNTMKRTTNVGSHFDKIF